MRRQVPALLALLGASLLLNAVLLVKREEPPASTPVPQRPAVDALPEALALERDRSAALERRVKELEVEKAILAQSPGAPPSRAERLEGIRERVRRYLRGMTDPREKARLLTPAGLLDVNETYTEFLRLVLERTKDPEAYFDALRTFFVTGLEDAGLPLDARQAAEFERVLGGLGARLRGLEALPALERFAKEVEATVGIRAEIGAVLSVEQSGKLEDAMNSAGLWGSLNAHWVEREHADTGIVEEWMLTYGLEEAQKPAALAAAHAYVRALDRLNASFKDGDPTLYGPEAEAAAHRVKAARALAEALESLRASLTAEQARRLDSLPPREIRFTLTSAVLGGEDPK